MADPTTTELNQAVNRLRLRAGQLPTADTPAPDGADPRRLAQMRYVTFSPALQAAMKVAARRWDWDAATWILQTDLIADALRAGRCTEAQLTEAYQAPPPGMDIDAPET